MSDPLLYAIVDEVGGVCDDGESLLVSTNRDELADDAHYMNRGAYEDCAVCVVPLYAHPPAALPEPPVDDKTHPRFMAGYVAGLKDGRSLERYDHETAPPARPALPDGWLAEADKLMWALFNAMHRHFSACQDNRAAMPAALEETAALNAVWDHLKRAVP